jgi:hypothetical protein
MTLQGLGFTLAGAVAEAVGPARAIVVGGCRWTGLDNVADATGASRKRALGPRAHFVRTLAAPSTDKR